MDAAEKVKELQKAKLVVFRGRLASFGFAYDNDTKAFVNFLDTETSGSVKVAALTVAPEERWKEVTLRWGWNLVLKSKLPYNMQ